MDKSMTFKIGKLRAYLDLMARHRVRQTAPVTGLQILDPAEGCFDPPAPGGAWRPVEVGADWGQRQQWAWFRARVQAPMHWPEAGIKLRLAHRLNYFDEIRYTNWPAGPEGQVFIDDRRLGAIDREHHQIPYPFRPGESHEIKAVFFAGRCQLRHQLETFDLAWFDQPTEKLYYDLRVALDLIEQLPEQSITRDRLTDMVDEALRQVDFRATFAENHAVLGPRYDQDAELFYASLARAQAVFDEAMTELPPAAAKPSVVAVGHAHIDLAWLWPLRQSRHKCVRTYATQCRLLEEHPDWIYFQSQPQSYAWVERDAPDLFARIRKMIAQGRWEAEGAMWVEADTNIPGGEALVRQLLYGKKYFQEKLGRESRILWLPDVFGYSAALPQILKRAGVDSFVTSKISWNQYNRFPNDTFRWRGIDGTELPTHFITAPCGPETTILTYNGNASVAQTKGTFDEYRQKMIPGIDPLLTFGFGDGGGGPTEEMIEVARRLSELEAVEAVPRIRFESVSSLMRRVEQQAELLPVWDGELYLELHRGTYTTQSWLKKANRKNELLLHAVEWLASLARPYGFTLDKPALDALWHDLLLAQFHDILPGSSIDEVYDEVRLMEEGIDRQGRAMTEQAMAVIAKCIETTPFEKPCVLFNTLSWDTAGPVRLPDGSWRGDLAIPAGGWRVVDLAAPAPTPAGVTLSVSADGRKLENQFWELRLDSQGRISSLVDRRAGRQVLAPDALANQWQLFEDRPLANDAWDIDEYYETHPLPGPECQSIQVVESGPERVAVELTWQLPNIGQNAHSTITQRLALYSCHPRIDFETTVDWHRHHQLLKVAFPVAIRATEATYQIQFGHLSRSTHRNTSWDIGRFEACAHQFVDLSEHGYGVALLNDCKYGHDIHDGVIRLTCVKSPAAPDYNADQGLQTFTYALLPHQGSFQAAGVIQAAAELNALPLALEVEPGPGELPAEYRFIPCDAPAAIIDTIKPAEDGEGLILRLYESYGSHVLATLTLPSTPQSVLPVDLIERPLTNAAAVVCDGNRVTLDLGPFELATLRVVF